MKTSRNVEIAVVAPPILDNRIDLAELDRPLQWAQILRQKSATHIEQSARTWAKQQRE
jgi:hypothetical protein